MAKVTWDEAKRQRVWSQRGVDLRRAALILTRNPHVVEDARHDYGERRYIAVGEFEGEQYTVVFTPRSEPETGEDVVHVITAWRGGRKPRRRHPQRDI